MGSFDENQNGGVKIRRNSNQQRGNDIINIKESWKGSSTQREKNQSQRSNLDKNQSVGWTKVLAKGNKITEQLIRHGSLQEIPVIGESVRISRIWRVNLEKPSTS